MRLPALLLLAFLTLTMNQGAREALSQLTNLDVVSGEFIFLNGTKDVAIQAKGLDQFRNTHIIRCRWSDGLPVAICVSGALEEL